MKRQTLPPASLLMRRQEGLVFITLADLRAGADWAAIGAEYFAGAEADDGARRGGAGVLATECLSRNQGSSGGQTLDGSSKSADNRRKRPMLGV